MLLPATPGWVSLPLVVGGPRRSWLGSGCGVGVWCVAVVCWWGCGWCVVWLVPRHSWRRSLFATPRHSWLGFAAAGGGRSPPLLAGVRWRRWCACFVWPGRTGRPPGRVLVRLTFSFGRFVFLLCLAPSGLGLPLSLSLLLPFLVGWGLWCVGWLLPGTCSCAVVRCVLCALSGFVAPGGRRCLAHVRVPWLWPAACLSGVPRGPAWCAAPRPVRSLSVLRSAFQSQTMQGRSMGSADGHGRGHPGENLWLKDPITGIWPAGGASPSRISNPMGSGPAGPHSMEERDVRGVYSHPPATGGIRLGGVVAADVGDAIRIDDLRGVKIPYYDGNPSNLDEFILDWEDLAEDVVGEMRGAPRDKWVCRTFPRRLAQDLKEELRDQIREGVIQTEQACLQSLEDEERVDASNQRLEDLWSIPLPLERGELRVRESNRYIRKYRRSLKLVEDWNEASEIRHLLKDVLPGHWKRRVEDEEKKRAKKRVAVRIMASEDTRAGIMEFFWRNLGEPSRMLGLKNAVYVEVFGDTMGQRLMRLNNVEWRRGEPLRMQVIFARMSLDEIVKYITVELKLNAKNEAHVQD